VGHGGSIVHSGGYGRIDWAEEAPDVDDHTLWDLASLTKVLATTLSVMVLFERGELDLDTPIRRYLPSWPAAGDMGLITLRHLLSHTSGLPAGVAPSIGRNLA